MPRYLTVDEQQKLLDILAVNRSRLGIRDCALIALMLGTGLRVSEVGALDLADLDLEHRVVKVRRGKGDRWRHVPLPEEIIPALTRYLGIRQQFPGVRAGATLVFVPMRRAPWAIGAPLSEQRLTREAIREILRRKVAPVVGRHVNPHQLRHSYASRLREHGAPPMLISESLGHADLSTTQIYAHLTSAKQRQEISKYWVSEA